MTLTRSRQLCAAVLVLVSAGGAAPRGAAQAVPNLPFRTGEAVIDVRATKVNDFDVRAPVVRAQYNGTDLTNATGFFEVRAADLRTGIGLRDRHLRSTLRADSFPIIRFELIGVDPQNAAGDSMTVIFQGRLTISGVTHVIRASGAVVRRAGTLEVIVLRFPVNLGEYNIVPPSRFMGSIQVQRDVHVNVRMTFGR